MKEYYIGLDVHKDSVLMAVLDDRKRRSGDRADSDVIGRWEVGFDPYHFLGKPGAYRADGETGGGPGLRHEARERRN
ncbi:MAG: hypothetical protein LBH70_04395 [Spirochaetaceae bacterium]|jgi:hypothetical protein|nr:hypothetical protein [Spirochaetaceae bacterium]